jgi:hydrogenase maturation protease
LSQNTILVCGIGNSLLSDDTIAKHIVDELKAQWSSQAAGVDFCCFPASTLDLLYEINGYQKLILVDSIQTGRVPAGTWQVYSEADLHAYIQAGPGNSHTFNFPTLLEFGKKCGFVLPREIILFGIEGSEFKTISEQATPVVQQAVLPVVARIQQQLTEWVTASQNKKQQQAFSTSRKETVYAKKAK